MERPAVTAPMRAALCLAWLVGGSPGLAAEKDPLQDEVYRLGAMLQGRQTPVDQVEVLGKALLKQYPKPEEQARIYYQLAHVHGQSGLVRPDLVADYAQRALKLPLAPDLRARLYVYCGDALVVGQPTDPFPDKRRAAARVYLEGLKEFRQYNIPEKPPDLPQATSSTLTGRASKKVKEEYEKFRAAWDKARYEREMCSYREVLVGQILGDYSRKPFAATELRELATGILEDPIAVQTLMNALQEKGALSDEPSAKPPTEPEPLRGHPWRVPLVLVSHAIVLVLVGIIIWGLRRRPRRCRSPGR